MFIIANNYMFIMILSDKYFATKQTVFLVVLLFILFLPAAYAKVNKFATLPLTVTPAWHPITNSTPPQQAVTQLLTTILTFQELDYPIILNYPFLQLKLLSRLRLR